MMLAGVAVSRAQVFLHPAHPPRAQHLLSRSFDKRSSLLTMLLSAPPSPSADGSDACADGSTATNDLPAATRMSRKN